MSPSSPASSASPGALADALLVWYARHRRRLPWRAEPGETPDPYKVWVSEIMLQQTTVGVVEGYFRRFMARWPTLESLARADLDEVLHAWQGLGYYARARNLHKCARLLVSEHGGALPEGEKALRTLPGIGRYTAAAIAAIAQGRPATVVDGNVERVVARLRAVQTPLPGARTLLHTLAAELSPEASPGDYAQALMDLGAGICTPKKPACALCPWQAACEGRKQGIAESLPRRTPRRARPLRHGTAFWLVRPDGAVLLRRRPEKGVLGGMIELPSTPWREAPWAEAEARRHAPEALRWRSLDGVVRHGFTHFEIELRLMAGEAPAGAVEGLWCAPARFSDHALPTLTRKAIGHAMAGTGRG